mmetsp:Transcript_63349/g.182287  ORF Transcript_63349/g.182287 Transcript_63349/m.182287 type:complete len:494 (+) Transcript_63349:178-1659(+)
MSPTLVAPWPVSACKALHASPLAIFGCCASLEGLFEAIVLLRPSPPPKRCSTKGSASGGRRAARASIAPSAAGGSTPSEARRSSRSPSASPNIGRRPSSGGVDAARSAEHAAQPGEKITAASLAASIEQVASSVQPLQVGSLVRVRELQQASRNFGAVDLMTWQRLGRRRSDSDPKIDRRGRADAATDAETEARHEAERKVAVKRMPLQWVGSTPKDFERNHQDATEKPWLDLGILKRLNDANFPYVNKLYGVFSDAKELYVITSYASRGDLFAWTFDAPGQGRQREAWLRPLALRLFDAVRRLHDLGIAHRDLSLENVLLEQDNAGEYTIKVIDYAMATMERPCTGVVGKRSYQPPESHSRKAYDPFLLDSFALGVMLFTLAMKDYPWAATQPEHCKLFGYVSAYGFPAYLTAKKLRKGGGLTIAESFTFGFLEFLEGLLELRPNRRFDLGEACYSRRCGRSARQSVWQSAWLETGTDAEDIGFEVSFAGRA